MKLLAFIDNLPVLPLTIAAIVIGLSPFLPQPHLVEKLVMLFNGTLSAPLDIADLLMHASPAALLAVKLVRSRSQSNRTDTP